MTTHHLECCVNGMTQEVAVTCGQANPARWTSHWPDVDCKRCLRGRAAVDLTLDRIEKRLAHLAEKLPERGFAIFVAGFRAGIIQRRAVYPSKLRDFYNGAIAQIDRAEKARARRSHAAKIEARIEDLAARGKIRKRPTAEE